MYLSSNKFQVVCSSVRQPSLDLSKKICKRDISVSILASASSETNKVVWGSKKSHRKIKLNFPIMANPQNEIILEPLRLAVKEQVTEFPQKLFVQRFVILLCTAYLGRFGTPIERRQCKRIRC